MQPWHGETSDDRSSGSSAVTSPAESPGLPAVRTPPESPVGGALATLATIDELPLDEQPDAYLSIHEQLRGALAEIDDA